MTMYATTCSLVLLFFTGLINGEPERNVKNMYHAVTQDALSLAVQMGPDTQIFDAYSNMQLTVEELGKPIIFTKNGLNCFILHVYNDPRYAGEVLPFQPFGHVLQFFEHGIATKQSRTYARAVLRLFEHKFNEVDGTSAATFEQFLRRLPSMLEIFLKRDESKHALAVKKATNFMYDELSNNADKLESEPDVILENITRHLLDYKKLNRSTQSVGKTELRHAIINFLRLCISKLMWSPQDGVEVWNNFNIIAHQLYNLRNTAIAARLDDIDDCLWTLVTRFKLFLAVSGAQLPQEFFEKARVAAADGLEAFDTITEQEEYIRSKSLTLQDALLDAAARAHALGTLGLITDDIGLVKPLPVESSIQEVHADTKTFTTQVQQIRAGAHEGQHPEPEPYFIKQEDSQTW